MKLLHSKIINHKPAELFLADDFTVVVRYGGCTISESGGETWLNIEGIYDLYLEFCVKLSMQEELRRKERENLREEARRLGWKDIS